MATKKQDDKKKQDEKKNDNKNQGNQGGSQKGAPSSQKGGSTKPGSQQGPQKTAPLPGTPENPSGGPFGGTQTAPAPGRPPDVALPPGTSHRVQSDYIFGLPFWYDPSTGNFYETKDAPAPVATTNLVTGQVTWGADPTDKAESQRLSNYYGQLATQIRYGGKSFAPMPAGWTEPLGFYEGGTPGEKPPDGTGGPGEGGDGTGGTGGGGVGGGGTGTGTGGALANFDTDLFDDIAQTLQGWGIGSLADWVKEQIIAGSSHSHIMRELRKRPEYDAAFPEQKLRKERGLPQMSEAAIFSARGQYGLVARRYGVEATSKDFAALISGDVSASEWEHRLDVFERVKEHGEGVQWVFQNVMGINLSDRDMHEFFDEKIQTPELDKAFEDAYYRGLPALVGLGIRPEEEADMLRALGINPEQAFKGYQELSGQLPIFAKLDAIRTSLAGQNNPTGNDLLNTASFDDLLSGIVYDDPTARLRLRNQLILDASNWKGGGRPTSSGGVLSGLTAGR